MATNYSAGEGDPGKGAGFGGECSSADAARRYLQGNRRLREALGIAEGAVLDPVMLGEGEHNRNYVFSDPADGRRFVLRINVLAQLFHDDQVRYEYDALRALEPSRRVPRPLFLDNGPDALGNGVLVESFCEGDQLDFDHLRSGDMDAVAAIMADVHAVLVSENCPLYRPADPLGELFEEAVERYEVYYGSAFEQPRLTAWAERFIAAAGASVEAAGQAPAPLAPERRIVNTEPLASHFLIDHSGSAHSVASLAADAQVAVPDDSRTAEGPASAAHGNSSCGAAGLSETCACRTASSHMPGKALGADLRNAEAIGAPAVLSGWFVDWERPIVGEPAQDVAYFASPATSFWDSDYLFTAEEADRFTERYWQAVDGRFPRGNFDRRLDAYRKVTALRAITWCLRGLIRYSADSKGHQTEKTKVKLPIYLSDEFLEMIARECFGL